MSTFDDLDAPQFSTFTDDDLDQVETYFEIDHESNRNTNINISEQKSVDEPFYSPLPYQSSSQIPVSSCKKNILELRSRKVRRSLSTSNIQIPKKNSLENKNDSREKQDEKTNANNNNTQFKYGQLRKAASSSQSKLRWCSQENINRLAAPKRINSSSNIASSTPFVSVAEAVKKFQELTPTRFHSKNKKIDNFPQCVSIKLKATLPQSPYLITKKRVKNNAPILSHEERELLKFQEAQQFRVRAHPVNKKVLQQPVKAIHIEKKPSTLIEPFNITEPQKKNSSPKKEEYHFHAKPVPKSVLGPPKLPNKQKIMLTKPVSPPIVKKVPNPSPVKKPEGTGSKPSSTMPLRKTQPEPFSFENRDKKLILKKEQLIKKVVEEEKKAREFHAKPIPKSVATILCSQKHKMLNGTCSNSSSISGDTQKSNELITEEIFKARPATVLYQKPFQPKKLDNPFTEIQPFNLQSQLRAKERENFEKKMKEKEAQTLEFAKQLEEESKLRQEEEIKMIRKEINFKAQPIRKFKEIVIKPSGKVTQPKSPVFLSGKSNKENVIQSLGS